jgi:hypothetical protein
LLETIGYQSGHYGAIIKNIADGYSAVQRFLVFVVVLPIILKDLASPSTKYMLYS